MRVAALFLFALSLLAGAHAQEQASSYPHKAIRLIVPFPPGGTTDIVARLLAQGVMADKAFSRGRAVFIDNRSGAEGMIGAQLGARAAPDGYTLTVGNNQTHAINATLFVKPMFDAVKDVAPVAMLTRTRHAVVVNAASPVLTFTDLIAAGQRRSLNYGVPSVGSSSHILSEALMRTAHLGAVAVPYRGASPLLVDQLRGEIDFTTASYGSALSPLRAGKLRALLISGEARDPLFPDVPTFSELGLAKNQGLESWIALYAPAKTPEPILRAWSDAAARVMADPKVAEALQAAGFEVWFKPREEMGTFQREEVRRWGALLKASGITLD
jgi:tripartite-type tricarboxylate transporter receptor subunit TctC